MVLCFSLQQFDLYVSIKYYRSIIGISLSCDCSTICILSTSLLVQFSVMLGICTFIGTFDIVILKHTLTPHIIFINCIQIELKFTPRLKLKEHIPIFYIFLAIYDPLVFSKKRLNLCGLKPSVGHP